jgi:hypothetical protein
LCQSQNALSQEQAFQEKKKPENHVRKSIFHRIFREMGMLFIGKIVRGD